MDERQSWSRSSRRAGSSVEAARLAARGPIEATIEKTARQHLAELERHVPVELTDPRRVVLRDGTTLADAIERRAVESVFAWPEWTRLFGAVREGVISTETCDPYAPVFDDEEDEEDGGVEYGLPGTTSVFAERFAQTVVGLAIGMPSSRHGRRSSTGSGGPTWGWNRCRAAACPHRRSRPGAAAGAVR